MGAEKKSLMYSRLQIARKYIRYYLTAKNGKGHGVHSPFVYDFIRNVLNDRRRPAVWGRIESLRARLLKDDTWLEVEDMGAGSSVAKGRRRQVKEIARHAAKPAKLGQLLFRIADYYQCRRIVELGTSLGISTAYLASGGKAAIAGGEKRGPDWTERGEAITGGEKPGPDRTVRGEAIAGSGKSGPDWTERGEAIAGSEKRGPDRTERGKTIAGGGKLMPDRIGTGAIGPGQTDDGAMRDPQGQAGATLPASVQVWTIEGAAEIAAVAIRNFQELDIVGVELVVGNFDEKLNEVLDCARTVDLVFIDGNHRLEPTLRYFRQIMERCAPGAILIFDDVHWSEEMEKAWEEIQRDPRVYMTIDLFFIGLVVIREEFKVKQHFTIRF